MTKIPIRIIIHQLCAAKKDDMNANFIIMIVGVIFMMIGIFRFTLFKNRFTKSYNILGFTFSAEMISILLFVIGSIFLLLFLVNEIQPLFYKGRELQRKIQGG